MVGKPLKARSAFICVKVDHSLGNLSSAKIASTGHSSLQFQYGCSAREIVELQIDFREHLRHHNDLPGVHREVFDDVKDCLQAGNVTTLNCVLIQQPRRVEIRQRRVGFTESSSHPG